MMDGGRGLIGESRTDPLSIGLPVVLGRSLTDISTYIGVGETGEEDPGEWVDDMGYDDLDPDVTGLGDDIPTMPAREGLTREDFESLERLGEGPPSAPSPAIRKLEGTSLGDLMADNRAISERVGSLLAGVRAMGGGDSERLEDMSAFLGEYHR